jgi:hypothetical protein
MNVYKRWSLGLAIALLVGVGCGGGSTEQDASTDGPDEHEDLWAFYELMRENALDFVYADGAWDWDQGDGRFYGNAFYAQVGHQEDVEAYRAIAQEVRDQNVVLLENAISDFSYFVDHLEEVIMAAQGLMEYSAVTGDEDFLPQIESIIDDANDLLALYGDYLDVGEIESWALELYGPTTITGGLALLNLQYAINLSTGRRTERIDRAVEIVASIDAHVLDGTRYLFAPGEPRLFLYPNIMMIIVLTRLYELTGTEAYLDQAEGVFDAIQALKYSDRPGYHSPYSAEIMGATTDDYSTLSTHNYTALAMLQLYSHTDDETYLAEAFEVLDFIRLYLYEADEGRLLHHWMDGQIAQPEDFEYWCSGCNLQFLYVVWYLRTQVLGL